MVRVQYLARELVYAVDAAIKKVNYFLLSNSILLYRYAVIYLFIHLLINIYFFRVTNEAAINIFF